MENLLIYGIETLVGSNLITCFSKKYHLTGVHDGSVEIESLAGCKTVINTHGQNDSVKSLLNQYKPDRVIFCSPASVSTWQQDDTTLVDAALIETVADWAEATASQKIPFTVISSDGIFTGPWMFHKEECQSLCNSPEAQMLSSFEKRILEENSNTFLARTHAYGWQPDLAGQEGWIEKIVADLESENPSQYSSTQYATPILAEDLADRIEKGWEKELSGVYHIAGAERICPQTFVEKLAITFGLKFPHSTKQKSLTERPLGYGLGDTSLNCQLYRTTVGEGMPLVQDGLEKLKDQKSNGYAAQLNSCKLSSPRERVA